MRVDIINNFICPKCDCEKTFIKKSGNHTGLYCSNCGKWIKWLTKDEIRVFNFQQETKRE